MSEKRKERRIVVNATALDMKGALSILEQFVANIPAAGPDWLIYVSDKVSLSVPPQLDADHVRIEPVAGVKSLVKRFLWDMRGLDRRLRAEGIEPVAWVSMQNTGFRLPGRKKIPGFIYYHQPNPFFPYRWNPLKKEQRSLWFYKHIYPFFVKLLLHKDVKVIVQLDFLREAFSRIYRHPLSNVEVYFPEVSPVASGPQVSLPQEEFNLFFPGADYQYKNHAMLSEAVELCSRPTRAYYTGSAARTEGRSTWLGRVPYSEVCAMFDACDALAFPSYVETLGLPLLEAALSGLPVVAADLPYARSVLAGYEGAVFADHTDPRAWARAIDGIEKGKRFTPINLADRPGWKEFFAMLEKSVGNTDKPTE